MARLLSIVFCLFLILLSSCDSWRGEEMRQQLSMLQQWNQADSLLTNDSLAQALADWFDCHGTPNEQLEAHYLLGRTHADRGEAPAAIAAYHDAIDRADTTATDCNYRQLYKAYGQMSDLFYRQNLLDNQLECLDKAAWAASRAGDTLMAIHYNAYRMGTFDKMGMPDTVLSIFNETYRRYSDMGYRDIAARYCGIAIKSYLLKNDFEKAKECMDIYETESGFFDDEGNIEKGREVYYNQKARYYLAVGKQDSALHYFSKELHTGRDFNNQNMGAKGMATLYTQTGQPDSALKYSLYSYAMNDSIYTRMSTQAVANAQGLYDYSHHQALAKKESEKREELRRQNIALVCILCALLALALLSYRRYRRKRDQEMQEMRRLQDELLRTHSDVLRLRSQKQVIEGVTADNKDVEERLETVDIQRTALERKICEKETLIESLQQKLDEYRRKEAQSKEGAEERISKSKIYGVLNERSVHGKKLTDEEWNDVLRLVEDELPAFNHLIMNKRYALNDIQYRTCILLRLHVPQSSISNMLGVSAPYIHKMCCQSLQLLFNVDGTGTDLSRKLQGMC